MAIKATDKRQYLYQAGMTTHSWITYPTLVVLQGEGGWLSVWQQQDESTYTGPGIILGERLYANVGPYETDLRIQCAEEP
jgi:hypothetical protein